ncbi:MAG: hypothetical protein LH614_06850 [Pyrinomonadaceae bacterium]|nr:hypothetical protein [Pyrinomonadaceae bacterium]
MKLVLLSLIIGSLFTACSLLSSSTTKKKVAPDELFYVFKYDEAKKMVVGFMDKTGKIVVGPWESFE